MKKILRDFPRQFKAGIRAAKKVSLDSFNPGPFKNIIVCGMGGSAFAGEIILGLRPLNIFLHKSYGLPLQANNESLIICLSYSGNTEETISSFKEALNRNLSLIAISSGGELIRLSQENKTPFVLLPPPIIPPRASGAMQFASLVQVLANNNLVPQSFAKETLNLGKSLKSREISAIGKKLAKRLYKKLPAVYTTKGLSASSLIWKNNLNENAKVLAVSNYFPELNHNELSSFWKIEKQFKKNKVFAVFLRDKEENPRLLKQMNISLEMLESYGIDKELIDIPGESILEKMFYSIFLGMWTSYWLALKYKIDPTLIETVQEIKCRLNDKKKISQ